MHPSIDEISRKYRLKIFNACYGYSNNFEDAEDLTQEVIIRIWRGLPKFREDSSLSTWIYRITVNTCLMYRRKKKSKEIPMEKVHESLRTNFKDTEDRNREKLQKLIMALNEKDRVIIILYLEELTYLEIADILGISTNNVGVRINRIKNKLMDLNNDPF